MKTFQVLYNGKDIRAVDILTENASETITYMTASGFSVFNEFIKAKDEHHAERIFRCINSKPLSVKNVMLFRTTKVSPSSFFFYHIKVFLLVLVIFLPIFLIRGMLSPPHKEFDFIVLLLSGVVSLWLFWFLAALAVARWRDSGRTIMSYVIWIISITVVCVFLNLFNLQLISALVKLSFAVFLLCAGSITNTYLDATPSAEGQQILDLAKAAKS